MSELTPEVKPFVAAAGRAMNAPVDSTMSNVRRQAMPYTKDIAYVDVVSAPGNITGTSNQIRVLRPTLVSVDGFFTSGATPHDFGGIKLWMQGDGAGFDERQEFFHSGPYFYLPKAGIYYLRGSLLSTPLGGAIVSNAAMFRCSVHEDVDPLLAAALLQTANTKYCAMGSRTIAAATVTAYQPPAVAPSSTVPPGTILDANGMAIHAHRITFTNVGANPATFGVNFKTPTATVGIALAVGASYTVNVGGVNTVYFFSTAGTDILGYYEYR